MGKIEQIIKITEKLEKEKLHKFKNTCLREYSAFSNCSKCVDVCPANSLEVSVRKLIINPETCLECGACTSICPVHALQLKDFSPTDIADDILMSSAKGEVKICCDYLYYLKDLENRRLALLPCFAVLDENLIMHLFASGIKKIELYEGNCSKCPARSSGTVTNLVMESMNKLCPVSCKLELIKYSAGLDYEHAFVELGDTTSKSELSSQGQAKREFFKGLRQKGKKGAIFAGQNVLNLNLESLEEPKISDLSHNINHLRNSRILAIKEQLEPDIVNSDKQASNRLFCDLSIDFETCNGCNLCYSVCPTSALHLVEVEHDDCGYQVLGFLAQNCINCKLCQDACKSGCVSLLPEITFKNLYSKQEKLLKISTYLNAEKRKNG